jgi:hypothetical protein
MGLDLYLLPFDSYPVPSFQFSHTILNCHRSPIFEEIQKIEEKTGKPVSENFYSFLGTHRLPEGYVVGEGEQVCEEHGYGVTKTTPYGEEIYCVLAKDLVALAKRKGVTEYRKNKAIWAYLAGLDPETPVALYWH